MNESVTAEGMNVQAVAGASLLISKEQIPDKTSVSFAGDKATTLTPMTWFDADEKTGVDTVTGEGYYTANAAPSDIKQDGSFAEGKESYSAVTAPTVGTSTYYMDYIVYIANAAKLTDTTLSCELSFANLVEDAELHGFTHQALTVDMKAAYAVKEGTLSVMTWDDMADVTVVRTAVADTKDAGYKATIDLTTAFGIDTIDVPRSNTNTVCVIMRVYFDGDLKDTTSQSYYVQSQNSTLDGVGIKAVFSTEGGTSAN